MPIHSLTLAGHQTCKLCCPAFNLNIRVPHTHEYVRKEDCSLVAWQLLVDHDDAAEVEWVDLRG